MNWTNEGKFSGLRSHELRPIKGAAVWNPDRREYKNGRAIRNANGYIQAVFHEAEEVIVRWYDYPKERTELLRFDDFHGKWTDKYTGGYWLGSQGIPGR